MDGKNKKKQCYEEGYKKSDDQQQFEKEEREREEKEKEKKAKIIEILLYSIL